MNVNQLRTALAQHLGRELTPEVAAAIEAAARPAGQPIDVKALGYCLHQQYAIQAEPFQDVLPRLHQLHALHWQETERHRHGLPLAPDYEAMAERERAGRMVQFTVRDSGGDIVGHLRMYLGVSLHTGTLFAEEDTLFILPEHRGGMLAVALLRFVERALRGIGVREIRADSKLVNRADVLMRRLGYDPVALKFVKVFKDTP